ncbi:hypothetical protein QX776_09835 [Alteromonadaceae bacterium BrNp21-10]|nr:hypothetical protein [Alteromonadaceae bacterium BrNp21-10]
MKIITLLVTLLVSASAFAHEDHHLGEDHLGYHIAFYALLALVVFKGYGWWKAKKAKRKED